MTEACELASTHSWKSAELGKVQYDKRIRHNTLYEGDRVLVRNLSDRGGPGKLRPYWEQEIFVVTQKRKDMPVYEVRSENGGERSRVLHRNLILPCSYLPVEAPVSTSKSSQKDSRKVTKRQLSTEGTSSNADDDMPNLTPHQFEELFESAGANVSERYEHAPVPAEQDADPFYADDPDQEQGTEDSCEQVATSNDDADAVDEGLPWHSQRTSRPSLRMTYDVPGQPSFQPWTTAGVQGISATYQQQILPPYRVPWMLQPLWKPCCQCFAYMHLPVQFGPMTHVPYCY